MKLNIFPVFDISVIAISSDIVTFTGLLVLVGFLQVAVYVVQACYIKRGLTLTRIAAVAAQTNAESLVNSERAWVLARLEYLPGYDGPSLGSRFEDGETIPTTSVPLRVICKNDGRSPAWIVQKRVGVRVVDSLPDDIGAGKVAQVYPEPLAIGAESKLDYPTECDGHTDFNKIAVCFAVIEYKDIFGERRETSIAYRIDINNRLVPINRYNKNN